MRCKRKPWIFPSVKFPVVGALVKGKNKMSRVLQVSCVTSASIKPLVEGEIKSDTSRLHQKSQCILLDPLCLGLGTPLGRLDAAKRRRL